MSPMMKKILFFLPFYLLTFLPLKAQPVLEKIKKMRENVGILEKMLYGGSALLAVEHLFHGEIMLYPPFLTAMQTPENIPEMLHEMSTVGVGMALTVTAAWAIAMGVRAIMKRFAKKSISDNAM